MRRLRERSAVRGYRAASAALARLPLRVSVPGAKFLFLGAYHLWPSKRRYILANAAHILRRPLDDPEVGRLARRIYATYARYVVELMRLPSRPPEEPALLVDAAGPQGGDSFGRLHEELWAQGRGMIAVSAHIGNVEALAAAFAARGWPTYAVADDSAYPELYDLLTAQRRRWGVEVIAWRNLREIYRVLRGGAILGLLIDWGYRSDGVPVRLFGSWTTLPSGPAVLSAKTGAPIVPVVCRRRPDGRFAAMHFAPIQPPDSSPAAIARATQRVADALEEMVAAAPEQWYTFKPMWPESAAEERALEARVEALLGAAPLGAARPGAPGATP